MNNKKNWRSRCSVHVEMDGHHIQVDAAPEFRLQCIDNNIRKVDTFILTHSHADHIMGMDDLRDGKKAVELFFNSVFASIDDTGTNESSYVYQIPDDSNKYNNAMLNSYLLSILKLHLDDKEYDVLRMSYGLDCVKHSATEIANKIGINGSSSYVRVSQLKKQAIQKLIDNVDSSQVIDFL